MSKRISAKSHLINADISNPSNDQNDNRNTDTSSPSADKKEIVENKAKRKSKVRVVSMLTNDTQGQKSEVGLSNIQDIIGKTNTNLSTDVQMVNNTEESQTINSSTEVRAVYMTNISQIIAQNNSSDSNLLPASDISNKKFSLNDLLIRFSPFAVALAVYIPLSWRYFLFDWRNSIVLSLSTLLTVMQFYAHFFYRGFLIARNLKYLFLILGAIIICSLEAINFSPIEEKSDSNFLIPVRILSQFENETFDRCTRVNSEQLNAFCPGRYFVRPGIDGFSFSELNETLSNLGNFIDVLKSAQSRSDVSELCFSQLQKLVCARFFPTCDFNCARTKICYVDCDTMLNIRAMYPQNKSNDCTYLLEGILFTQRTGAELLIRSVALSSRNPDEIVKNVFRLLESIWNNCTNSSDIFASPGEFSCSNTNDTKYPSSFVTSQTVSQGNCRPELIDGNFTSSFELDIRARSVYFQTLVFVTLTRVFVLFLLLLCYIAIVEFLKRKQRKNQPNHQITIRKLNTIDLIGVWFCLTNSLALSIFLYITSAACFRTTKPDVGFIVLVSNLYVINNILTMGSALCYKTVPDFFAYPARTLQKLDRSIFIVRLIAIFRENFGRGGSKEKLFLLIQEIIQVCIQTALFTGLCKSADVIKVILTSFIVFFDLTIVPMLLLSSKKTIWRDLLKFFSMLLRVTSLSLFCSEFLTSSYQAKLSLEALSDSSLGLFLGFLLGCLVNSYRISDALLYFSRLILVNRLKEVENQKSSTTKSLSSRRNCWGSFIASLKAQNRYLTILVFVVSIAGSIFFTSVIIRLHQQQLICEAAVGKVLWTYSRPRVLLRDGLFAPSRCGFDQVKAIYATGKKISILPDSISLLHSVEILDFSHNDLSALPSSILQLSQLKEINLGGNVVNYVLNWSNAGLISSPGRFVSLLHDLRYLDLSQNALKEISNIDSRSLIMLNLSYNEFVTFPFSVGYQLTSLRNLDLAHNKIGCIPVEFFRSRFLSNLKVLNLSKNVISHISYEWSIWSNPTTNRALLLDGNQISQLQWGRDDFNSPSLIYFPLEFNRIAQDIKHINLSHQSPGFGSLPQEIGTMIGLTHLDLSNCSVALFPSNFCNLTKLEYLDLTKHNLGQLGMTYPDPTQVINCFSNLTALKWLNMSQGQRSYAVDKKQVRVQDAPNIEVYNVSGTRQFVDPKSWIVPRMFASWSNLQVLDLSGLFWQDFTVSFSFPSSSDCAMDPDCTQAFEVNGSLNLPTSWRDAPLSLKKVDISNMFKCTSSASCDDLSSKLPLDGTDYQQLLSIANFSAAGFSCETSSPTALDYVCLR